MFRPNQPHDVKKKRKVCGEFLKGTWRPAAGSQQAMLLMANMKFLSEATLDMEYFPNPLDSLFAGEAVRGVYWKHFPQHFNVLRLASGIALSASAR